MWKEIYLEGSFGNSTDTKEYEDACSKLPNKVYKYLSFNNDYVFKNLESNVLTFTRPDYFNDPYDCAIFMNIKNIIYKDNRYSKAKKTYETIETIVEKYKSLNNYSSIREQIKLKANIDISKFSLDNLEIDKDIVSAKKQAIDVVKNKVSIGCLSEKNDSILMWSHYAYNHSGFCIEYSFYEIQTSIGYILPVIYTENPSSLDICTSRKNNILDHIMPFLIKSKDWKYEQEWRIIKTDMKLFEERRFVKMPKPTAIYMGCKISSENEERLEYFCTKNNISLYKMQMKEASFNLEYVKIM